MVVGPLWLSSSAVVVLIPFRLTSSLLQVVGAQSACAARAPKAQHGRSRAGWFAATGPEAVATIVSAAVATHKGRFEPIYIYIHIHIYPVDSARVAEEKSS